MLLATDLDGTFLAGDPEDRLSLYQTIAAHPEIKLAYVTDQAWRICELAIQVQGGRGYTRSAPLEQYARDNDLTILARITGYATGGGEPKDLFFAPIQAVQNLMKKQGTKIGDYDLVEANEAFAAQALANGQGLGWDWDRVNVHGGAVALGHPIGASGARDSVPNPAANQANRRRSCIIGATPPSDNGTFGAWLRGRCLVQKAPFNRCLPAFLPPPPHLPV